MPKPVEVLRDHERRIDRLEHEIEQLRNAFAIEWGDDDTDPVDTGPAPIELDVNEELASIKSDLKKEHAHLRPHRVEGDEVIMPSPTTEQKKLRKAILENLAFENLDPQHGLSKEDAEHAFVEGGPYWLWLFDREYLVAMPPHVKQIMVNDVLRVDPDTAHELGRDILKADDGVNVQDKIDQILSESENAAYRTP